MKAPVKKPKTPVKTVAKAVKPAEKTAVPLRSSPKPVLKSPAKSAPGSSVKTPIKASPPVGAKKDAKLPVKAVPKTGSKQLVVPQSAAKKAAITKPLVKPKAPGAKASSGTNTAAKALALSKSTGKPVAKAPLKNIQSVVSVKEAAVLPLSAQPKVKPAASPASLPVTAAVAPSPGGLLPRPPLKPGRRSSARTAAHMPPSAPMLPTHAPDAAKATYSTVTERVIAPPPHVAAKKDPKLANNWKTKSGEELVDDEVKAMPDSEYMNDKQMAFFRQKLSLLKRDIHNSAGETTEHLREDTVVVPDPADRATIEEEHALELRTRDRERKLLKKIEQSIARIDTGDYGYCDETGEPIGVGRLIARPTASLSLEAQQRRELKQKMFGD